MKFKLDNNKMRILNKKGTISIEFIIGVIILIISFVVLLFLLFGIPFNPAIDKEVCHQSIVYRSTAKVGFIDARNTIPLKCKTEKICLTMSGDDCKELSSTKDNPVRKVKLGKDNNKAREKILEVLAENMVSCHSMLGEGQLNFFPNDFIGFKDNKYGLICTRLVFDKETKDNIKEIGFGEFFAYLEKKTINEKSYLEYLYPGWKDSKNSIKLFEEFKKSNPDNKILSNLEFKDWKIDLTQENGYAIIVAIATKEQGLPFAKSLGYAAIPVGVALLATGVGAPVGATLLIGGTASAVVGGVVFWYEYGDEYRYFPPFLYPYNVQILKNTGIYGFEIAP